MRGRGAAEQLWSDFTTAVGISGNFTVVQFGDTAELADELAALVVSGKKRATTALQRDYVARGGTIPKPGNFSVVVDSKNQPVCIIRTMFVDVKALRMVDEDFARDDGGGDQSLAWWRAAHVRYFKRQGASEGFSIDDDTQVVLERFVVVWPLEFADRYVNG